MTMTQPDFTTISAAIRVQDWTRVEHLTSQFLVQHPKREELMFMLAVSLQMQERTQDTLAAYEHLIECHPANATYWGNYATELRKAGRLDDAGQAHANALRLKPDDVHTNWSTSGCCNSNAMISSTRAPPC
jgi:cytochrome c-type biogenesis protein CcmH/NrfG